ncbi:MAG: DUF3618 domain-containing protein [Propionibacterium sp.]|nr:DUF3618 domain-containing protein [Propionibacterium sp.]
MASERTVEDIRAELAGTRAKLRASVADLTESVKPKNIAKKSVEEAKSFVKTEYAEVKSQFVEADGSLRTKRVLAIAGAVVGVVAFAVTVNALAGRRAVRPPRGRKALEAA